MAERNIRRAVLRRAAFLCVILGMGWAGYWALTAPDGPIPNGWHPLRPLAVSDPVTPITGWKLNRTAADPVACRAALADATQAQPMDDAQASEQCHIRNRVRVSRVGEASLSSPVETTCAIALRLAMWEAHSLQPAAAALGTGVAQIHQIGSYNCRQMRTTHGAAPRMSTHATAEAIDITGFRLTDGRRLTLLADWDNTGPDGAFLRAARDGSCRWFATTLGPDYNALHADHFHLQSRGWGTCR